MLREQVRADLLAFSRRPETLFFTVFLPVIFLVLFEAIFGGQTVTLASGDVVAQSFLQVPAFMVMGVISASFVALAITVVNRRETGTFKRVRGTPAPAWVLIAGQVVTSLVIAILMVLVMLVLGSFAYGVRVDLDHLPWLVAGVLGRRFGHDFGARRAGASVAPRNDANPVTLRLQMLHQCHHGGRLARSTCNHITDHDDQSFNPPCWLQSECE